MPASITANISKQSRRSFLKKVAGISLGASMLPLAGCESLAVDPVATGFEFPFLTPTESFFVQYGADGALAEWKGLQQIPRNTWRLAIDGLVDNQLSLSFADLDADPTIIQTFIATLRCILDNNAVPGLIGTATWTGVPLRVFLDRAGINMQQGKRIRLYGADGFTNNIKLDKIYGQDAAAQSDAGQIEPMLVFAMNGSPLENEHGAPVRLLMPGHYGYKSIKWLERIEVVADDTRFGTYQEILGYDDDGTIDISCKSTSILKGALLTPGPTRIAGFALSGYAGIAAVDITINDEPTQSARIISQSELLANEASLAPAQQFNAPDQFSYPFTGVWTLFEYLWDAPPGTHVIRIEAKDASGNIQPQTDDDPTDGQNPVIEVNVRVE